MLFSGPAESSHHRTINLLSKTRSAAGWRLEWVLARAKITGCIRKGHDFLTVGAPTPFQNAAVRAFNLKKTNVAALKNCYAQTRDRLCEAVLDAGFYLVPPEGAYYIMADADYLTDQFGADAGDSFTLKLVHLAGLTTLPGTAFYHTKELGNNQVRFRFGKSAVTPDRIWLRLEEVMRGVRT